MKFNISYSKLGNQFFFISNLAEWHFSCRKTYNAVWLEKLGELSFEEKTALNKFAKIVKKYGFNHYLGIPFIVSLDKNVWAEVKKWITAKEYDSLQNIFHTFEKKFNKIWSTKILNNNLAALKKELGEDRYKKIDRHLKNFFGAPDKKTSAVNIYLLKHPMQNWQIAGGANLSATGITIECNKLIYPRDASVELAAAVACHEFIHMAYQKILERKVNLAIGKDGAKKIPQINNRPKREVAIEIIINSLFPKGYLADKYLHYHPYKNMKDRIDKYADASKKYKDGLAVNLNDLAYYIILQLRPLTEYYMENNKSIDKKYIKEIARHL